MMKSHAKVIFYLNIDATKKRPLKKEPYITKSKKNNISKTPSSEFATPIDAIEKVKSLLERIKNS